jgi:hypothetical protein
MTELIDRIVAKVGVDPPVAEKAVGLILGFLAKEGPADKVQLLVAKLPGHEQLMASGNGGGMGGIMGLGAKLMGAGLDMSQIQAVVRELAAYAQDRGAAQELSEVAASIPGLSQFI